MSTKPAQQLSCHFCKIQFNPNIPYHKDVAYTKPEQVYDVCSDCVTGGIHRITDLTARNPHRIISTRAVLEQLSLDTGISIPQLYSTHHRKEG